MDRKYNTIEEALEELRAGKIILVTDDEDRENEGDFICAAEFATQANVNFMALKMTVEFEEGQDPKKVMEAVLANCKKVEDDCEIFF